MLSGGAAPRPPAGRVGDEQRAPWVALGLTDYDAYYNSDPAEPWPAGGSFDTWRANYYAQATPWCPAHLAPTARFMHTLTATGHTCVALKVLFGP